MVNKSKSSPSKAETTKRLIIDEASFKANPKKYSGVPTEMEAASTEDNPYWFSFSKKGEYYPVSILSNTERVNSTHGVTMRVESATNPDLVSEVTAPCLKGVFWFAKIVPHIAGQITVTFSSVDDTIEPLVCTMHVTGPDPPKPSKTAESKAKEPAQEKRGVKTLSKEVKVEKTTPRESRSTPNKRKAAVIEEIEEEEEVEMPRKKSRRPSAPTISPPTYSSPTRSSRVVKEDELLALDDEEEQGPAHRGSRLRRSSVSSTVPAVSFTPVSLPAIPVYSQQNVQDFITSLMPPPMIVNRNVKHRLDPLTPFTQPPSASSSNGNGQMGVKISSPLFQSIEFPPNLLSFLYQDYYQYSVMTAQHIQHQITRHNKNKGRFTPQDFIALYPASLSTPSVSLLFASLQQRCGHVLLKPSTLLLLRKLFEDIVSTALLYQHEKEGMDRIFAQCVEEEKLVGDVVGVNYFLRYIVYLVINMQSNGRNASNQTESTHRVKGVLYDVEKIIEASMRLMDENYLTWFY